MLKSRKWHLHTPTRLRNFDNLQWLSIYLNFLSASSSCHRFTATSLNLSWELMSSFSAKRVGWYASSTFSKHKLSPLRDNHFNGVQSPSRRQNLQPRFVHSSELWSLFITSWGLSRSTVNTPFVPHRDFKLLFVGPTLNLRTPNLIDAGRYFARWTDSYNLMFNLFYADSSVQLMSNRLFVEESMIFNWHYSSKNYKLFKYVQPSFIFKDLPHGGFIHSSVRLMFVQNTDLMILVDLKNHEKLLGYLTRYSLYSIALVPTNCSPWLVSYPIPTFAEAALSQFHFLRWLFYIKNSADHLKFTQVRGLLS
jgi:hypothetical protein